MSSVRGHEAHRNPKIIALVREFVESKPLKGIDEEMSRIMAKVTELEGKLKDKDQELLYTRNEFETRRRVDTNEIKRLQNEVNKLRQEKATWEEHQNKYKPIARAFAEIVPTVIRVKLPVFSPDLPEQQGGGNQPEALPGGELEDEPGGELDGEPGGELEGEPGGEPEDYNIQLPRRSSRLGRGTRR